MKKWYLFDMFSKNDEKFAGPSAHGVWDPAPRCCFNWFIDIFDNWPPPLGPLTPKSLLWRRLGDGSWRTWRPLGRQGPIFIDFWPSRRRSKNHRFFDPFQNRPKWQNHSTIGGPKADLGPKNMTFGSHFGTGFWRFFDFFWKCKNHWFWWQLHRFTWKYHPETLHFSINFPWNFHVFSEPLSDPLKNRFLETQSARLSSKVRFWSHFLISGDPKIDPWSDISGPKGAKRLRPRKRRGVMEPTWPRLGAENAPKRPKNRFYPIFDGVLTALGWIFHDFGRFSNDFDLF